MKLSEIKGEGALDVLAELLEPASAILADKKVAQIYNSNKPKIELATYIIKIHKKEVIEILAVLDGEDPKTYADKINIFTLPMKLLELLNDEDLLSFFQSQGQNMELTSSGSVMENTEVEEK